MVGGENNRSECPQILGKLGYGVSVAQKFPFSVLKDLYAQVYVLAAVAEAQLGGGTVLTEIYKLSVLTVSEAFTCGKVKYTLKYICLSCGVLLLVYWIFYREDIGWF